jgi:hypothetical protein
MWNKYGAKKVVLDGIRFDSKKEAGMYQKLKLLEMAGAISDLKLQVPFELIPVQKDRQGKVIERKVTYKADFTYWEDGQYVVVDAKGVRTKEYILKRKLLLFRYGIRIREV